MIVKELAARNKEYRLLHKNVKMKINGNYSLEILNNILENYKPVPENVIPDITMTTSEVWEKVEGVIPGYYSKSAIAQLLQEKGYRIVDASESFDLVWGFWMVK